jgi:hypothetical protein
MDNDEVEHVLPQYAKIVFYIEDLEEQAFVTKTLYQTTMEHRTKHNTPPTMMINIEIWQANQVNVL